MDKKYFLVEITFLNDGSVPKAIYEIADPIAAEMQYHQTFASGMANPDVTSILCFIMDENGYTLRQEKWTRPVTEEE